MKSIISVLIIFLVIGCKQDPQKGLDRKAFRMPFVVSALGDSAQLNMEDSCSRAWNLVLGKQTFTDTVIIKAKKSNRYDSGYIQFHQLDEQIDSFTSNGFQIKADYKTTIAGDSQAALFPLYVYNETSASKILPVISEKIPSIIEALDSNKHWRPIQYSFSFGYWICGNAFGGLKVNPNEFVTILYKKFDGLYKTRLRIRLIIGESIIFSEPFEGKINYSQFYVEKKGRLLHSILLYNYGSAVNKVFYGATPLGYTDPHPIF